MFRFFKSLFGSDLLHLKETETMKKFLIIGLGNIGSEYADTRHNVGFKVLDALADHQGFAFETARWRRGCYLR